MQERLQKILAQSGIASRRKAEELIVAGRVQVNGKKVTELGTKADLATDTILVNGTPIKPVSAVVYMLNKPVDVISTAHDEQGRLSVLDFAPKDVRLYPVGRLDRMSEGLLLLTNDGALADRLTHPRYEHEKEYELTGVTTLSVDTLLERLSKGARLADGVLRPDRVSLGGIRDNKLVIRVVLHEGRNHLLRRLCSKIGFEITRLKRIRIGGLPLGDLAPGKTKLLSETEIRQLLEPKSDH